ncbi:hypothetical protein OIU74_016432 [Salix koriyanagi]|uniref:Uncharacterized protein n=1 Tax=Salix koriyanagi TaxID=2511006 RepID=A0A9Q0SSH0_9ROSI|nr:hypothetical protein OIU74_016432 [Salix koriyanagi]
MLRERRWETSVSLREQPKASAPAMILRGRGGGVVVAVEETVGSAICGGGGDKTANLEWIRTG